MMVGKMLDGGDLTGLKFTLVNAMKDLRYYTHFAESLPVSAIVGEAVHQSLVNANLMGFGDKYVPSLIEAQEKLNGVKIVGAALTLAPDAERSMRILLPRRHEIPRPACVDAALARGHAVTLFTRGRAAQSVGRRGHACWWAIAIRTSAPGLDALPPAQWDAVIDTSGYVPRCRAARRPTLLRGRVGAIPLRVVDLGLRRCGVRRARRDPRRWPARRSGVRRSREDTTAPLKAACEDEVRAAFGDARDHRAARAHRRSARLRPTGSVTGSRASAQPGAARAIAPPRPWYRRHPRRRCSSSTRAISPTWMIELVEATRRGGTFNACSPAGHWTMGRYRRRAARARRGRARAPPGSTKRCCSSRRSSRGPACRCGSPRRSRTRRDSWTFDCRSAQAAGTRRRARWPIPIDATARGSPRATTAGAGSAVLTAAAEREILAAAASRRREIRRPRAMIARTRFDSQLRMAATGALRPRPHESPRRRTLYLEFAYAHGARRG